MATVHVARATDCRQGPRLVAIKRPHSHLASDKVFLTMLVDEARLASAITHPNVVKVRELGFDGGVPFIVLDYVEGASLAELRRELTAMGRALDARVAVRIMLDVLGGLHAAHELSDDSGKPLHIVHRDVSPHNILIGSQGRSHITDFGIAKAEDRVQTTRTHEVKGKLAYLAPERIDKRRICTVQSDVFSAAVVLWECFAGRRLFRHDQVVDLLQEVMTGPIPTLTQIGANIPGPLDDVIARGLSRDLNERFGTARAFAGAIEAAAGPEHTGTEADVARLIEAVFGARMAARQERLRAAIGSGELSDLLRQAGLPSREGEAAAAELAANLLSELAPEAPSGRYALGSRLPEGKRGLLHRLPWWPIASVTLGIAFGAIVSLVVLVRREARPAITPLSLTTGAPASGAGSVDVPMPASSTRLSVDAAPHEESALRPGPVHPQEPRDRVRDGFTRLH